MKEKPVLTLEGNIRWRNFNLLESRLKVELLESWIEELKAELAFCQDEAMAVSKRENFNV